MTLGSIQEGNKVLVRDNAKQVLYDNSGYGAPTGTGNEVVLSLVEALYLIEKEKISIPEGLDKEEFLERASDKQESLQDLYRVYDDLRERGYYLGHTSGEPKIELYPRGVHPGESEPSGYVLPLSEHDSLSLDVFKDEPYLGVVDDDNDVTYFKCEKWDGYGGLNDPTMGVKAKRIGDRFYVEDGASSVPEDIVVTRVDEEAYLTPLEANYLDNIGLLDRVSGDGDEEIQLTYNDLRNRGFAVRSGFKFGFDFRLYNSSDPVSRDSHSSHLVKTVKADELGMNDVSRLVRVAEGVKKTAVLSLPGSVFVEVERIRP